MYQTWGRLPSGWINESWINENIWDLINSEDIKENDYELFFDWTDSVQYEIEDDNLESVIEKYQDRSTGYTSFDEMSGELAESNFPEAVESGYFDYQKYEHTLRRENTLICGVIFSNS